MKNPQKQRRKQKRQRNKVVARALRNRDETRRKLIQQGRELARRRAENVERSRERSASDSESTNPSVHSTTPPMDSNREAAARHAHSSVPPRPKGTTVPAADRLYGLRLYEQIRADGAVDDGSDPGDSETTGEPSPEQEAER